MECTVVCVHEQENNPLQKILEVVTLMQHNWFLSHNYYYKYLAISKNICTKQFSCSSSWIIVLHSVARIVIISEPVIQWSPSCNIVEILKGGPSWVRKKKIWELKIHYCWCVYAGIFSSVCKREGFPLRSCLSTSTLQIHL